MRRLTFVVLLLCASLTVLRAQEAMTTAQRNSDLTQLASLYAKNYGPYEWKRDALGFDLMRLTPWLQRVHHSDDIDFQEALIEYVSSLNDAHDLIAFPTTFSASLPMTLDIYDGKVLIDSINRAALPIAQFPFGIGDEIVSFDGQPVRDVIASLRKYSIAANTRSTDRVAATRLVSRSQQTMPGIHALGPTASVAVRLASTGATGTYAIPWRKIGIPLTSQGPLPSPVRGNGRLFLSTDDQALATAAADAGAAEPVFQVADAGPLDDTLPAYMDPIRPLLNVSLAKGHFSILGVGARTPIYQLPAGFVTRPVPTGFVPFLFSGTYVSDGVRIGLIRIPSMSPPSVAQALAHLDQEIAFFNANTDALVIDVMRNPGGLVSFVESISQRFIPTPFQTIGFEIRATSSWLFSFAAQLTNARLNPATPPAVLANLEANHAEVLRAFNANRGRTAPISLNATGSLTLAPAPVTYGKPLIVLTDEFSASGGDMFPAIIQDNGRGPIVGMRTMGAGGSVVAFNGPAFTESIFRITVSLMNRGTMVQTPDFPPAPYIENIGVRPDTVIDYMTRANLMTGGQPFVQAFTQAVVNHQRQAP
jgi:hypothetical protein